MKSLLATITLTVLLTATLSDTAAQTTKQISMNQKANLVAAIKSDNIGLQRSAIYFAGYYQINETVESLVNELDKTDNPQTKVLIALALFQIGDISAINDIAELAMDETENLTVRHMANAIYREWNNDLKSGYAAVK